MVELYYTGIYDLLVSPTGPKKNLEIKEDIATKMMQVKHAQRRRVESVDELKSIFEQGLRYRKTAATGMNGDSSRSHLVLSVVIETKNLDTQVVSHGKISFVDLAGSEKVNKSLAEGLRLKET